MPNRDRREDQMIAAFGKAHWSVAESPFQMRLGKRTVFADLRLERKVDNQYQEVIEVKCFADPTQDLQEIYNAIGQYSYYRQMIETLSLNIPIFLAVPHQAYQRLILDAVVKSVLAQTLIKMVLIDIGQEVIVEWIL